MLGLGLASGLVDTDLDGVFGASEQRADFNRAELGEMFGEEGGVVKTTSANVVTGGRERDDDGMVAEILRKSVV